AFSLSGEKLRRRGKRGNLPLMRVKENLKNVGVFDMNLDVADEAKSMEIKNKKAMRTGWNI
ncbi:MAG: hypothetical protein WCS21_05470, partial [Lachnospiraceae bacterium]